jgi:hypothetical protein
MVDDEWLLIGRAYSRLRSVRDRGAGVMRTIKGNIWAIPTFAATAIFCPAVVFSPQLRRSK